MNWKPVASIEEVPEDDDEMLPVSVGDKHVVLIRLNGDIHAVNNVCTHQFAFLSSTMPSDRNAN